MRHRDRIVTRAGCDAHGFATERREGCLRRTRYEPRIHGRGGRIHERSRAVPRRASVRWLHTRRRYPSPWWTHRIVGRAGIEGKINPCGNHVDGAGLHLRDADGRDRVEADGAGALDGHTISAVAASASRRMVIGTVPAWPASPVTTARAREMPLMAETIPTGGPAASSADPARYELRDSRDSAPGPARSGDSRRVASEGESASRRVTPVLVGPVEPEARNGRTSAARWRGWWESERSPRRRTPRSRWGRTARCRPGARPRQRRCPARPQASVIAACIHHRVDMRPDEDRRRIRVGPARRPTTEPRGSIWLARPALHKPQRRLGGPPVRLRKIEPRQPRGLVAVLRQRVQHRHGAAAQGQVAEGKVWFMAGQFQEPARFARGARRGPIRPTTPSFFCRLVEEVVYWNRSFFSGYT